MSCICEIIHNHKHPEVPRKLSSLISRFGRKIISKFNRVLHRRRKATAAMSTIIPVNEELNHGHLYDVDYNEEDYEASNPPNPLMDPEQQTDSNAEVIPTDLDTTALEDDEHDDSIFCELCNENGDHDAAACPNDPTSSGIMYCTICRHIYPGFCKKPEEHCDRVEDYKYCGNCDLIGDHKTAMCLIKPKWRVLVCSVCKELYPCKNQEEHGNKSIEVNNLCSHCFKWGHLPQECTDENWHPTLAW